MNHPQQISTLKRSLALGALLTGAAFLAASLSGCDAKPEGATATPTSNGSAESAVKPALTVTLATPQRAELALTVTANGSIAAWQEAIVGAETQGLRLAEVRANVGDVVKRGQVLATFAAAVPQSDLAQARAAVAEAEATLVEASANARRARDLQASGALSEQQINQFLTAERTADARLQAQRALFNTTTLRLSQTQVLAPDDGVISGRLATVGEVVATGQELFRLIRQGRLEWRAEVPASDLARLAQGMAVQVTPAGGQPVLGKLRTVAPTVDAATRNGLVYVDLPQPGTARAGMFARGEFQVGASSALTLPQSAVLLRDGFSYVFQVATDNTLRQLKVEVGRRVGERIEVISGLDPAARVVASGGSFLGDGDTVRVVAAPPAIAAVPAAVPAASPAASKPAP